VAEAVVEPDPSPERTLIGVTRLSRGRGGGSEAFDVVLSGAGMEIRRPEEASRHLPWDRISEWEIEPRRGGVRLFLRGGGSVTPLSVPGWGMDELDAVLRELTAPAEVAGALTATDPVA
jgi:hypothetical protein